MSLFDYSEEKENAYQNMLNTVLQHQMRRDVAFFVDTVLEHVEEGFVGPGVLSGCLLVLYKEGKEEISRLEEQKKIEKHANGSPKIFKEFGLAAALTDDALLSVEHIVEAIERVSLFAFHRDFVQAQEKGTAFWSALVRDFYPLEPDRAKALMRRAIVGVAPAAGIYQQAKEFYHLLIVPKHCLVKEEKTKNRPRTVLSANKTIAPGLH